MPAQRRLARWIGVFAIVVFWVLLVGVAESVVRAIGNSPGYFPRNPREDPLYVADSAMGYALKPGAHHDYVTPEVSAAIDISSDGLRDTTARAARQTPVRIMSVGDSFTMGLAVEAQDTWSQQLERMLAKRLHAPVAVVNAGVPGYSARQIRQRLARYLPMVAPQVVIYGFTTETFTRMQNPVVFFGGTLVRSDALRGLRVTHNGLLYSPFRTPWLRSVDFWLNEHFELGAHVLDRIRRIRDRIAHTEIGVLPASQTLDPATIQADMQPALEEMKTMKRDAELAGARFLVLLINMQRPDGSFRGQDSIYNATAMRECAEFRITCVDLLPALRREARDAPILRTKSDQHWTPCAHRIAADSLLPRVVSDLSPRKRVTLGEGGDEQDRLPSEPACAAIHAAATYPAALLRAASQATR
jgi:hypothetical protein